MPSTWPRTSHDTRLAKRADERLAGEEQSFDLVEATADMAVENGSLEQVPPDLNHAPEPSFIGPAPKVITFDCYGALVRWYEVLLDEG